MHNLMRYLPKFPRKRYTIFTGTNTNAEWYQMARAWLMGGACDTVETIATYEQEFAKCCGVTHAISFGAGRMALYAILEALGIGDGDEIIIPAFTCVVVPNAIIYRGAHPVYVDIEPHFFNIDVQKVEAAITSRTKALYAQHTFGVPCDIDAIRAIAQRHGLPVIEDGAHALGASYQGKSVGSLTEVAYFSTDHSKVINTHLGGVAVTNNDELAARLRKVQEKSPFLEKESRRRLIFSFLVEYICFVPRVLWLGRLIHTVFTRLGFSFYFFDELDTEKPVTYPCRLSSSQAQLGISQLKMLQNNLLHRREIANWLEKQIGWCGIGLDRRNEPTWLRYSFLVKDRTKFEAIFNKYFELGIWFTSVVSGRTYDLQSVGYHVGSCPVAEYVTKHIVNFPTHLRIPLEVLQAQVERNWYWLQHEIQYGFAIRSQSE